MPEPYPDFRTYLPLARSAARKWAIKLRNWSHQDDFYQIASAEIWWQHLHYDASIPAPVEAVLFKRAEYAILVYIKGLFNGGSRAMLVGGWQDDRDFEFVESLEIPDEEIGGRPVFPEKVREQVKGLLDDLPLVQKAVIEQRYLSGLPVSATAEKLGMSSDGVLDAESRAVAYIRERLGLQAPATRAKKLPTHDSEGKPCANCGEFKLLSEFGRGRGGVEHAHSYCKTCAVMVSRESLYRRRMEAKKRWQERAEKGMRRCPFCQQEKPFSMFASDGRTRDGVALACDDCQTDWVQRRAGNTLKGVKKPRGLLRLSDDAVRDAGALCSRGRLCLAFPRLGHPADAIEGNARRLCYDCQGARLASRAG